MIETKKKVITITDAPEVLPAKSLPVDRRTLLGRGAAAMGGLAVAQSLAPSRALAKGAKPQKTLTTGNSFTLAIAGETMVSRPFSMVTDPNFLALIKVLREADLAYTHLETNLASASELKWAMRGSTGPAGYLVTDPVLAKDLAWAGIDVMSLAMNHAFDWGPDGMMATIKHCQEVGIATAGTGTDLESARAPTFVENPKGRVALISVASGNSAFEWAGLPKGNIPGRPGVNPLRLQTIYEVPHEAAQQLKATGTSLGVLSAANAAKPDFNITPGAISGSNGFSGFTFREGERFAIHTENHAGDVKGNLRSIEEAHKMADFVMVAHHNSTSEGTRSVTPSEFVVDFARKSIDGGADIYIGHGWHTFLGIEIYKGKPIFYGLGSFFVQSHFMPRVPADQFESYNFDMDQLTGLNPATGNLHPGGSNTDWEWTAVFNLTFTDKKLTKIELYPIEMGYDFSQTPPAMLRAVGEGEPKYLDGSPRLAIGANGQVILQRLQKLNALRGTTMRIADGIGVIDIA